MKIIPAITVKFSLHFSLDVMLWAFDYYGKICASLNIYLYLSYYVSV